VRSRFRLDHPHDPKTYVIYGHDRMLGYFAERNMEGRCKPATLDTFTRGRTVTLQDIFDFMIKHGFSTEETVPQCAHRDPRQHEPAPSTLRLLANRDSPGAFEG